jgi:hypothetical protein
MLNPAHKWLAMKAANSQYMYAECNYSEEYERFQLACYELAKLPAEVVAAAEAESAGQLALFGEVA